VAKKKKLLLLLLKLLAKPQFLLAKLQSMPAKLLKKLPPLLLKLLLLLAKLQPLLTQLQPPLAQLLVLLPLLPSNFWLRNEKPAFWPVFLRLQKTIESRYGLGQAAQGLRVGKPDMAARVM